MGKNKSSIVREINRNKKKRGIDSKTRTIYSARIAKIKSKNRNRQAKFKGMLVYRNDDLSQYIIKGLKRGWSPKTIAGRMKQQKQVFYASAYAIYQFLYSPYGQKYCHYLKSQRYRKKTKKSLKSKKTLIPNKISIHKRPNVQNKYCHFEADTIVSGKKTQSKFALSTIHDPKSMYIDARKIPNMSPVNHTRALLAMLKKFKNPRTITQDNGIENIYHEQLKRKINVRTFFCDPHSPWQKPGIENANKSIRKFIPKGSDISLYSFAFIRSMIQNLNNTPRKKLDWKTPIEILKENNLLKK